MSAHVAHNSGNNEWYTPPEYIEAARRCMGGIDLDPASCAVANGTVQATRYYTAEDNGLSLPWAGRVWLNPPYGRGLIDGFASAVVEKGYDQAIVLVNNATETGWFQRMAAHADAICLIRGRIRFYGVNGPAKTPIQGQALLFFHVDPEAIDREFGSIGLIWRRTAWER